MLNLNEKKQEVIDIATEMFERFVNMPKSVRLDDKERTGVQVVVWEEGTRNLMMLSIKEPSEAAKFFAVEKAVRSNVEDHYSSATLADPDLLRFPGSVSMPLIEIPGLNSRLDGEFLTVSTSGLKAEEDVAISLAIIAKITDLSVIEVCESIYFNQGVLPQWCLEGDKSYFDFLFE